MYRLIDQFFAHDGPVRCISTGPAGEIISGGQDAYLKRWLLLDKEDPTHQAATDLLGPPLAHSHWVVAVTQILPGELPAYPAGGIITGCLDGVIRVFNIIDGEVAELRGHEKGVISFSWTIDRRLVSGSWDGTAKVWDIKTRSCVQTFAGHENGVHVLAQPSGIIATVSTGESVNNKPANFKLRLWDTNTGTTVGNPPAEHSGPIRAIFGLGELSGFATTGNDGTIIFRDPSGAPFDIMMHDPQDDGSPAFILDGTSLQSASDAMCIDASTGTLAALKTVTVGEDGSVIVWQGDNRLAALPHPCSVWCVTALPGGDFATGGHDGMIRVFSADPSKTSTPAAVSMNEQFEAETAAAVAKRREGAGPSAEELARAPSWDDRFAKPGTSEGQVCIFRKETKAIAAQWSADSAAWVEIGDVVGGSGSKKILNGVEYDYVLPVEMDSPNGVQQLQLGCNKAENAFSAAQRFIDENGLGNHYLNQIADFITAQTSLSAHTIDLSAPVVPGVFVGQPGAVPPPVPVRGLRALPAETYCTFSEVPSAAKVMSKINEFNAETSNRNVLSASDLDNINSLLAALEKTSFYHSSVVSSAEVLSLLKLRAWGDSSIGGIPNRLFLCLDLCRAVAIHPAGAEVLAKADKNALSGVVDLALERILSDAVCLPVNGTEATVLTALRMFSNFFKSEFLRGVVTGRSPSPIDRILGVSQSKLNSLLSSSKSMRAACCGLLLNANIYLGPLTRGVIGEKKMEAMCRCCEVLFSFLKREKESADVVSKVVFALGTAFYYDDSRCVPRRDEFLATIFALRADSSTSHLVNDAIGLCLDDISTILAN